MGHPEFLFASKYKEAKGNAEKQAVQITSAEKRARNKHQISKSFKSGPTNVICSRGKEKSDTPQVTQLSQKH